jgi:biotin carboxyl carrier protein
VRRFKIKVNGIEYEVEVEETTGKGVATPEIKTPVPPANVQSTTKSARKPAAAAVSSKPKPQAQAPAKPASSAGPDDVTAPIPGVVTEIKVTQGQQVNEGDVLLVLEAMKMQNEIFAANAGIVLKIAVSQGDSVKTGDLLIKIG